MSTPRKKRPPPKGKSKPRPENGPPFYKGTESKLLPCPFCGRRDVSVLPYMVGNPYPTWLVRCSRCGAQMVVVTRYQSRIIANWNNRQPPEPLPTVEAP